MILYRLFLWLYPVIAKLISPFNEKAKQWVIGQTKVWEEVQTLAEQVRGPIIWVHCASYGEFEQGLPIIAALKKTYPTHQIWVSFFSPSGYLHRKQDPNVDFFSYLPLDSPNHAKKWLQLVRPKCIVFIKYEFWYYYLKLASEQKIPTILAAAIFRPTQIFFQFYGGIHRKMLHFFTEILVQDKKSKELIAPLLTHTNLTISGDTRFDRVMDIASTKSTIEWVSRLARIPTILAGSTWDQDHAMIGAVSEKLKQYNWIIVPHHVDETSIQSCRNYFPNVLLLSEFLKQNNKIEAPTVLIVDQIGLLSTLYQYAHIAYVGGGFTKDGIHNVLEAAVYGKPVIWGPNDSKYQEAIGLRNIHGGIQISDATTFKEAIEKLMNDVIYAKSMGDAALNYVQINTGATKKTMDCIKQIYA